MIKKIKNTLVAFSALFMLAAPAAVPAATYAACSNIGNQVSTGANQAANNGTGGPTCDSPSNVGNGDITTLASKIVNLFSLIVGAVAVIMLIYGGFRYITSGGASDKVGGAKNTLIYAIIGLVIVAVAQLVVHFVLNQTSTLGT